MDWKKFGDDSKALTNYTGRQLELKKAMAVIHAHEIEVSRALLSALQSVPGLTVFGLTDAIALMNAWQPIRFV